MGEEESGVSWTANAKDGQDGEGGADGALDVTVKAGSGAVLLESMLFKDDAKEIGVVEVSFWLGWAGLGWVKGVGR